MDERGAGRESTDVGKPRHATGRRGSEKPVDELNHDPETKHQDRRHPDRLHHETKRHQRHHPRPRKQHQIGPQHAGNGAAGADHRHDGIGIGKRVRIGGDDAGDQIKQRKPNMAQGILDIVAENPEIEHVAAQVQQAPMKKHRGEDGNRREGGRRRLPPWEIGVKQPRGDRAKRVEKRLEVRPEHEFIEKGRDVGADQRHRHPRHQRRGILISERDH